MCIRWSRAPCASVREWGFKGVQFLPSGPYQVGFAERMLVGIAMGRSMLGRILSSRGNRAAKQQAALPLVQDK